MPRPTSTKPAASPLLAGPEAPLLAVLFDEFFVARKPKKHSAHTLRGYANDLRFVSEYLADELGVPTGELRLGQVTTKTLRAAFGRYADDHLEASISRAWSTWNQFFTFLVADDIVAGNPMGAIARP